jgi:transcriptional regulator with XRE-family HTH domain
MNIGEKIKKIRLTKNLSQKEVAVSVSLDRGQYSRIENGKVEPTLSSLEKIAKAFSVKVTDFFSDENDYDINSYDKDLVEKVKLLDQLDDKQKKIIFDVIDTVVTNHKLKIALSNALNIAS